MHSGSYVSYQYDEQRNIPTPFLQTISDDDAERKLTSLFLHHFGDAYTAQGGKTVMQDMRTGELIAARFNRRGVEYITLVEGDVIANGRRMTIGEVIRVDPGEIFEASATGDSRLVSQIYPYCKGLVHQSFERGRVDVAGPSMSIVVIAKNIEHHICQCLISCMNQTYSNLQIVVVEDGSSDNTLSKCLNMAMHDDRVEIYSKNLGRNGARRYGLSKANGDYVVIVDGDDWLNEDAMEILSRTAVERSSDCLLYGYDYYSDRTHQSWGPTYPSDVPLPTLPLYYSRDDRSAYEVSTHNHTIWMYVFSRSLAHVVHDALIDVHLYEDLPFYLVMMGLSRQPVLCNSVLYHYRRDRIGQTTDKWSEVKATHKLACLQVALNYVLSQSLADNLFMQLILLYKVERIIAYETELCRVNDRADEAEAWSTFWHHFVRSLDRDIETHIIEAAVRDKVLAISGEELPASVLPPLSFELSPVTATLSHAVS